MAWSRTGPKFEQPTFNLNCIFCLILPVELKIMFELFTGTLRMGWCWSWSYVDGSWVEITFECWLFEFWPCSKLGCYPKWPNWTGSKFGHSTSDCNICSTSNFSYTHCHCHCKITVNSQNPWGVDHELEDEWKWSRYCHQVNCRNFVPLHIPCFMPWYSRISLSFNFQFHPLHKIS